MLQHFALTPGNVPIAQVTTTLPVNAYFDAALDDQHRLKGPGNESTSYMMERKDTTSFSAMPVILVNLADKHCLRGLPKEITPWPIAQSLPKPWSPFHVAT